MSVSTMKPRKPLPRGAQILIARLRFGEAPPRKRGGQPGNRNAIKHGAYSAAALRLRAWFSAFLKRLYRDLRRAKRLMAKRKRRPAQTARGTKHGFIPAPASARGAAAVCRQGFLPASHSGDAETSQKPRFLPCSGDNRARRVSCRWTGPDLYRSVRFGYQDVLRKSFTWMETLLAQVRYSTCERILGPRPLVLCAIRARDRGHG